MNVTNSSRELAARIATRGAWGILIITRILLFAAPTLALGVQLALWGVSLAALIGLLIGYNRRLAQWRVVAAIWLAYCGVRWLVTWLPDAAAPILTSNLMNLVTVLVMDTLLAGFAVLLILAIRRDVSVVYIALATCAGGLALLGQVRLTGGVLNWLLGVAGTSMQEGFALVEPLTMMGSCMFTLGVISFLPHLLYLMLREMRGR